MLRALDVGTSVAATLARLGSGVSVGNLGKRPAQRLQLYEFESCPFCRKVREAFTILDLEADVFPCPKNGTRFRPEVVERGGKAQFPWLVDPNTQTSLYESDDILRHLFREYGDGRVPALLAAGPLTVATASLAQRAPPGPRRLRPPVPRAEGAARVLELRGLPLLPHRARGASAASSSPTGSTTSGRGAPGARPSPRARARCRFPWLADPNTGVERRVRRHRRVRLERSYTKVASFEVRTLLRDPGRASVGRRTASTAPTRTRSSRRCSAEQAAAGTPSGPSSTTSSRSTRTARTRRCSTARSPRAPRACGSATACA